MNKIRQLAQEQKNIQKIQCNSCQGIFDYEPVIKTIDNKVSEYLLICPHCKEQTHCFYWTSELKKSTKKLAHLRKKYGWDHPKSKAVEQLHIALFNRIQLENGGKILTN